MTTLLFLFLCWESITLLLTSEGILHTPPRAEPLRDAMVGFPKGHYPLSKRLEILAFAFPASIIASSSHGTQTMGKKSY